MDFTHEQLAQLYPTHGRFVFAVSRRLAQLVRDRWYVKRDARELRLEAVHADVP